MHSSLAPAVADPSLLPVASPPGVLIRELTSADRAAVAFAFRHLGAQSRYRRFLADKRTLSERELDSILDVDHWHRGGVIALSPRPRAPIGLARYVRLGEFDTAEAVVEAVDDWQRRGVGRALLSALREQALQAGVHRFVASILRENRGALALARGLGDTVTLSSDGSVLEVLIELD